MLNITRWVVEKQGAPLVRREEPAPELRPGQVLVAVAGCGVCHTDIGFWAEGRPTVAPLPLALGHEISGFVVDAGPGAEARLGKAVIVPSVVPCGRCRACAEDETSVCADQFMPGNSGHGGFASHVVLPSFGLCEVPGAVKPDQPLGSAAVTLRQLSVLADCVSSAWQAVRRSGISEGGVCIVIGAGGVGSHVVQLARLRGAQVVAVDSEARRRTVARELGAAGVLDGGGSLADVAARVRSSLAALDAPPFGVRIFECSGTPSGQRLAVELLGPAGVLVVVGYTPEKVPVGLSQLMVQDARVVGTWGCEPRLFPGLLRLALHGRIAVAPLVEEHPLADVQAVMEAVRNREITRRPVLVPG